MDAFTVQLHVADWANAAGVARLDHVYEAIPNAYGIDLNAYGSGNTHCVGSVWAEAVSDTRRAPGAPDPSIGRTQGVGTRNYVFMVHISILHATTESDWIEAERQLKQDVCDGLASAVKADPSLGTWAMPVPLFKGCGEGRVGVQTAFEPAYVDEADGMRKQWATVTFQASTFEQG